MQALNALIPGRLSFIIQVPAAGLAIGVFNIVNVFTPPRSIISRITMRITEDFVGAGSVSIGVMGDTDKFVLATPAVGLVQANAAVNSTQAIAAADQVEAASRQMALEVTVGTVTDGTLVAVMDYWQFPIF